jgi:ATP-binding cassette, subfamily C, bacterial CydC
VTAALRRLLALAGMPRRRVALSVGLGAAAIACGVGLLAMSGYLLSRAAEHPPVLSLTVAIVAVRFFALARPLARYFDRLASHDLALRALARIRVRVYGSIEPLAPGQLGGYRRGDVVSRVVSDVDALQGLYLRGIGPPLVALVAGAACVLVTALLLPVAGALLALGLLAGGVVVPVIAAFLGRGSAPAERGELTASLVELLRGAPELVVYGRGDDELARIEAIDRKLVRSERRDALVAGLADSLSIVVTGLTVAGVLAVAVEAHSAGTLDRVLIATLALLALASFDAVAPLPGVARELSATLAAGRRVLALTDERPTVRDADQPLAPPSAPATVALEHVTARYPGEDESALEHFDLRLDPGRRVALVGPSGAGKTTVTNLLFRFLDPAEGRVTIAGENVRSYRQEDVRATFALAGQEAHLFDSSIRENLRIGRPGADDGELDDALARAQLADWVAELPDGLDTLVGEEGTELSGGQRQRLVLARALLSSAPVLVLDEPTAHLDPPTAERLMDDVLDAAGNRTVLLITHRREGLERMDEIVALPVRH